jgi:hypothetical protein
MCPIVDQRGKLRDMSIFGKMKAASHLEWRARADRAKAFI